MFENQPYNILVITNIYENKINQNEIEHTNNSSSDTRTGSSGHQNELYTHHCKNEKGNTLNWHSVFPYLSKLPYGKKQHNISHRQRGSQRTALSEYGDH